MSAQNQTIARLHFDATGVALGGSDDDDVRHHVVAGVGERVLDALVEGFAAADHLRTLSGVTHPPEGVTADLLVERLPFGENAARELRQVGEDFLRHLLGEARLSDDELDQRATALRSAVRRALEEGGKSPDALKRQKTERMRLVAEVGALLRELALELLDTDVSLTANKAGEVRLTTAHATETQAHVRLLGRLIARLELSLLGHELLHLEREASGWWFQKWSVEPTDEGAFARYVREAEWSLIERGTLYMGPVVDNFIGRGLASRLLARQRRLANAVQASFPGVFVVRDRRSGAAVFQDMDTGRRIEVHEHDATVDYGTGWIGLGRLYAFDGPIHLRSPGMALIDVDEDGLAERLAEAFRRGRRQLAPALAIETLISALTSSAKLPRPVQPARSPTDARQLLERATRTLAGVGLVEDSDEEAPATDPSQPAQPTRRYKVDATMGHWLGGLLDLGDQKARPGQARARAGAKKGKRKG